MFNHSTWRPAYGTLISPVTWFTDDPTTQYRGALGDQRPARRRVRRPAGRPRPPARGPLADDGGGARGDRRARPGGPVHDELGVVRGARAGVVPARRARRAAVPRHVVAALGRRRSCSPRRSGSRPTAGCCRCPALVVVLVAVGRVRPPAALVAGGRAARAARRRAGRRRRRSRASSSTGVWDDPAATNTAGGVLGRLGHVAALGRSLVGQVWYQLVVTVGVAGLGTIALTRTAVAARAIRGPSTRGSCSAPSCRSSCCRSCS